MLRCSYRNLFLLIIYRQKPGSVWGASSDQTTSGSSTWLQRLFQLVEAGSRTEKFSSPIKTQSSLLFSMKLTLVELLLWRIIIRIRLSSKPPILCSLCSEYCMNLIRCTVGRLGAPSLMEKLILNLISFNCILFIFVLWLKELPLSTLIYFMAYFHLCMLRIKPGLIGNTPWCFMKATLWKSSISLGGAQRRSLCSGVFYTHPSERTRQHSSHTNIYPSLPVLPLLLARQTQKGAFIYACVCVSMSKFFIRASYPCCAKKSPLQHWSAERSFSMTLSLQQLTVPEKKAAVLGERGLEFWMDFCRLKTESMALSSWGLK